MSSFRQLMMRNKGGGGSYQVVDYIESSGTQYIDTGFIPNKDTKIEITANLLSRSNSPYLFGAGVSWENKVFAFTANSNRLGVGSIFCFANNSYPRTQNFDVNSKNTITMSKDGAIITGTWSFTGSFSGYSGFDSANCNLVLCAMHWQTEANIMDFATMKLYDCKVWDNGTLVRDFVPVLNLETNKYGLLDIVNNVFYGNSGTGDFSGGNE